MMFVPRRSLREVRATKLDTGAISTGIYDLKF